MRTPVVSSAQKFADAIGTDSGCAIALNIDVLDMPDAFHAANSGALSFTPPPETLDAALIGGYDWTIFRYPRVGPEVYAGQTGPLVRGTDIRFWSAFPVDPAGRSYDVDPPGDP